MGLKFDNRENIPLSLALWLATDEYDHSENENTISVTALIKPIKQTIMGMRVDPNSLAVDVSSFGASRMGTAIHNSIEWSWTHKYAEGLEKLGYPKQVIDRVKINPDPETLDEDDLPIYMENRVQKEIAGMTVTGQYDFVSEGRLRDFKSTSTYAYTQGSKDKDYIMQGSIYRWLNPEIITDDWMSIDFIFTDWKAVSARTQQGYPASKFMEYQLPLKSLRETERYIKERIITIQKLQDYAESDLPPCDDDDLWRKPAVYKYYKNPANKSRSTKNYSNAGEAYQRLSDDGFVGEVVEVKGEVVACKYCQAVTICKQAESYILDGSLKT